MTSPNFLRCAAWAAFLSVAVTLLMVITGILMFTNRFFAVVTDVLSVFQVALMIPVALALHLLLRSEARTLSLAAAAIGILGMLVKGIFQSLLVMGVLTYEQSSPASDGIGSLGIGIWLLLANYLAVRGEVFPRGLIWAGLITGAGYLVFMVGLWTGGLQSPLLFVGSAAFSGGYLVWGIWLGRRTGRLLLPGSPSLQPEPRTI